MVDVIDVLAFRRAGYQPMHHDDPGNPVLLHLTVGVDVTFADERSPPISLDQRQAILVQSDLVACRNWEQHGHSSGARLLRIAACDDVLQRDLLLGFALDGLDHAERRHPSALHIPLHRLLVLDADQLPERRERQLFLSKIGG